MVMKQENIHYVTATTERETYVEMKSLYQRLTNQCKSRNRELIENNHLCCSFILILSWTKMVGNYLKSIVVVVVSKLTWIHWMTILNNIKKTVNAETGGSLHKGPIVQVFCIVFMVSIKKLLNKQPIFRWVTMQWRPFGVTVMFSLLWLVLKLGINVRKPW